VRHRQPSLDKRESDNRPRHLAVAIEVKLMQSSAGLLSNS
jgi:hypothetical protein